MSGALKATPRWTIVAPVIGAGLVAGAMAGLGGYFTLLVALGLAAGVFAANHHAEVIAHRVGEPYGTLILALAVTLIEVSLIGSVMLAGGEQAASLARDAVFATVMIILNGIVGLSLLIGGLHHRAQAFSLDGVSASLVALAAITVTTLILPHFTLTVPGPFYSRSQLVLVAGICATIYGAVIVTQTVVDRALFQEDPATAEDGTRAVMPSDGRTIVSGLLLVLCLAVVVASAHTLAPVLERRVVAWGAPNALVGVIIAMLILLPEGTAAIRAARQNRLQTSLNLALGSALATIGLTIPVLSLFSIFLGIRLALGIDMKSVVLLVLSIFTTALVLRTGRTMVLHGIVLLVLFVLYVFLTLVP